MQDITIKTGLLQSYTAVTTTPLEDIATSSFVFLVQDMGDSYHTRAMPENVKTVSGAGTVAKITIIDLVDHQRKYLDHMTSISYHYLRPALMTNGFCLSEIEAYKASVH